MFQLLQPGDHPTGMIVLPLTGSFACPANVEVAGLSEHYRAHWASQDQTYQAVMHVASLLHQGQQVALLPKIGEPTHHFETLHKMVQHAVQKLRTGELKPVESQEVQLLLDATVPVQPDWPLVQQESAGVAETAVPDVQHTVEAAVAGQVFRGLFSLLEDGQTLPMSIQRKGDVLLVVLQAAWLEGAPPLAVKAPPHLLDEGFAQALQEYQQVIRSVADTARELKETVQSKKSKPSTGKPKARTEETGDPPPVEQEGTLFAQVVH